MCLLAGASPMVISSLLAQGYLTGAALNKKIVMDFYRVVFDPRNMDLPEQYTRRISSSITRPSKAANPEEIGPRWPLSSRLFRSPLSTISARK